MVKPGALLLLLAVAAGQLSPSEGLNISDCPITFYGRTFTFVETNITSLNTKICFKNSPDGEAMDCVSMSDQISTEAINGTVQYSTTAPGSSLHQALLNISSTSNCHISFSFFLNNSNYMRVNFHNFGRQSALEITTLSNISVTPLTVTPQFNNTNVVVWSFSENDTKNAIFMDLTGCRLSDSPIVPSTILSNDPDSCSSLVCDAFGDLQNIQKCGSREVCQGENKCIKLAVCTVTGSTVIDFLSTAHSVSDRCIYSLIRTPGNSSINLMAGFRERRRRDVTFLDHLVLRLNETGVKIYLEQGGRVRVDEQTLMLNATAQLAHGVELSKDHTGVTAKIPFASTTIFFDGNTAHVEGLSSAEGLCGNSTLSAEKSKYSPAGCEIQHNDTFDSTINYNQSTEHCNLMRQAPFTGCDTDPEPFITACTNTLCKYPTVDGLKCQFFDAYARSCSLEKNVTLENWGSKTGCSAVFRACQDQYCSMHEYCGERYGESRCYCRADFASKYNPTNTLGEPTVCRQDSATLTLAGCLMENKGIDYSVLHLKNQSCKGRMDQKSHMVTFSFDSVNACGTEVMMNDSQVIYKNTIMSRDNSMYSNITRFEKVDIDFSCYYAKPSVKSLAFKIKDGSVTQKIVSGVWNYTVTMNAFTDYALTRLVKASTEVLLNQRIYVELKTLELDDTKVAVVTDSCWATNMPASDSAVRYDLVINGCPNPADQTVQVKGNGQGTSNVVSFNMFEFAGANSEIYLHCSLELCLKQGNSCVPSCGGGVRKRRSSRAKFADAKPAVMTMAWSN